MLSTVDAQSLCVYSPNCEFYLQYSLIYFHRLFKAKMLNYPKIVFDFAYDEYMKKRHCQRTAREVLSAFLANRRSRLPFDMLICNGNIESSSMQNFQAIYPNLMELSSPLTVQRESYMDLYPKERLLYITPYSPHVMHDYDPHDILIVPAMIDYGRYGPVTMADAKKNGIRTARLPVRQSVGRKLSLDVISNILLEYKNKRDWEKAFAHLPHRSMALIPLTPAVPRRVFGGGYTSGEMPHDVRGRSIVAPPAKHCVTNVSSVNATNDDEDETNESKQVNIKDLKLNPNSSGK